MGIAAGDVAGAGDGRQGRRARAAVLGRRRAAA